MQFHECLFSTKFGTRGSLCALILCSNPEENKKMRKIVLALASVAALGLALPVVSAPADAREVVIIKKKKKHWNRGHHYGWYKKRHHHGATVIVR